MISMVDYVHLRLKSYGHIGVGVDMTMGNGFDTLALAKQCDYVYSFDVQNEAIQATSKLVKDFNNIQLILDNHANVDHYIDKCDVAIFNLGYLPQYSHEITTLLETTKIAIKKIVDMMSTAVFIVVYPGHNEGFKESQWIDEFACSLNSKQFNVSQFSMLNKNKSPYVIEIEKRKHII